MSDDVKRLRELYDVATRPAAAGGQDLESAAAHIALMNALPALLDEVEAVRAITDGSVWFGRWNFYRSADGWIATIPSDDYLRDAAGNVRRFPTLPEALMAIKEAK